MSYVLRKKLVLITILTLALIPSFGATSLAQPDIIKPFPNGYETAKKVLTTPVVNNGGLSFATAPLDIIKEARDKRIRIAKQKAEAKRKAKRLALEKQRAARLRAAQAALPQSLQVPKVYQAPRAYTTSGNTYTPGYCTWYVKNARPNIPNGWHDASNWYGAAQSSGWPTGAVPRVGAVAWAKGYGHVALVTGISGGNVIVTEMNVNGWNVVSSRTTPASDWLYIY